MGLLFISGSVGFILGMLMIIVTVFREGQPWWIYVGRWVTFFSLLTLLGGLLECILESNRIFGT